MNANETMETADVGIRTAFQSTHELKMNTKMEQI